MNVSEFLQMGGYGVYVWSAYAVTLMVFGINIFLAYVEKRKIKKMTSVL